MPEGTYLEIVLEESFLCYLDHQVRARHAVVQGREEILLPPSHHQWNHPSHPSLRNNDSRYRNLVSSYWLRSCRPRAKSVLKHERQCQSNQRNVPESIATLRQRKR